AADLRADGRPGQRLAAAADPRHGLAHRHRGGRAGSAAGAGAQQPAAPAARGSHPMKPQYLVPIVLVVILGLLGSMFVVREGHVGLVLNLGRVARTDLGPGLHFKIPLVESARVFDRRFTANEFPPERSLTSERKDVSVDFVAIGFIVDAADFYRATGGNEELVTARLAPIIKESLRNEINSQTLTELVSGNR